jgi:hypothetical protein
LGLYIESEEIKKKMSRLGSKIFSNSAFDEGEGGVRARA